jgi:hypothetical protein
MSVAARMDRVLTAHELYVCVHDLAILRYPVIAGRAHRAA